MNKENFPPIPGKILIIEGNISAGKSTLSRELGRELGYEVFLEPTLKNPYLEAYYKEPKKYALKLQLWILRQRFKSYIAAIKMLLSTGKGVILDRSVYSDCVFAEKNFLDGNISKNGYLFYQALHNKMLGELPVPHITLYLDVPAQTCFDRVHQLRGRSCESGIPLDYLQGLDQCYKNFVCFMEEQSSTVIRIPWANFGQPHDVAQTIMQMAPAIDVESWAGNVRALRALLKNEARLRNMMVLSYRLEGVEDDEEGTELDAGIVDTMLDGENDEEMSYEDLMDLSVADSEDTSVVLELGSIPESPSVDSIRSSPTSVFDDELRLVPSPIRPPITDTDAVDVMAE